MVVNSEAVGVGAFGIVKLVILVGMEQRTLGLATGIRPFKDNVTRTTRKPRLTVVSVLIRRE